MALCQCTKQPPLLWCCKSRIRLSPRGKLAPQTYKITTSQIRSHASSKTFLIDLVMLEEALVPLRPSCSAEVVELCGVVRVGSRSFTAGERPLGVRRAAECNLAVLLSSITAVFRVSCSPF